MTGSAGKIIVHAYWSIKANNQGLILTVYIMYIIVIYIGMALSLNLQYSVGMKTAWKTKPKISLFQYT